MMPQVIVALVCGVISTNCYSMFAFTLLFSWHKWRSKLPRQLVVTHHYILMRKTLYLIAYCARNLIVTLLKWRLHKEPLVSRCQTSLALLDRFFFLSLGRQKINDVWCAGNVIHSSLRLFVACQKLSTADYRPPWSGDLRQNKKKSQPRRCFF